jgi:glycosyltransferase involved in cell wall biosynthesis
MAHRLRGLYDTYHLTRLPLKVDTSNSLVRNIVDYIEDKRSTIDGLFDLLDELYANRSRVPQHYFDFPGPFIRAIIHFLDDKALEQSTSRFAAISKTVKDRKEYFPRDVNIDVVYPPSFLTEFKKGSFDYLFTVSRLDTAKRVALMIQAMKYVKGDIKLKIAGTGPMEAELKAMAAGDKRIEFLGFVNDDKVIDYYANAKAVLFLPYDEDYGLVTIEAMRSHKPVITCRDSGGPIEFVEHGKNGYIAAPEPKSLAEQINALLSLSSEQVKRMGEAAYDQVKDITWDTVTEGLLNRKAVPMAKQTAPILSAVKKAGNRKKITVASTFRIYPPQGGGQVRIYNIYKKLAQQYDVEIVAFTNSDQKPFSGEIADNLTEIRIPKSRMHTEKEWEIQRKIGLPITDAAMPLLSQYTEEYGEALKHSLKDADVAVASHPYLVNEILQYKGNIPFVYEAIDVEYFTKSQSFPKNKASQELLNTVRRTEELCCRRSDFIIACSDEDRERLCSIYDIPIEKTLAVPNGVDCSETCFVSQMTTTRMLTGA